MLKESFTLKERMDSKNTRESTQLIAKNKRKSTKTVEKKSQCKGTNKILRTLVSKGRYHTAGDIEKVSSVHR